MRRRLSFAMVVVVTQLLLIGLAIAWLVHTIIIATKGSVYFVESNPVILWLEITAIVAITVFAVVVFALQIIRLGERRRADDRGRASQD